MVTNLREFCVTRACGRRRELLNQSWMGGSVSSAVVQVCLFALPLLKVPVPVPPPNGQVEAPAGQNLIWSEPITPEPRKEGSVLEMVSSNALPSVERHAVPVEIAMTLLAVFV